MATISRDIRLSVTAEVQKYVAEMKKIPGTTEKQAAAAGRALARELAKAEGKAVASSKKAASTVAGAYGNAANKIDGAGDASKNLKERLDALKFAAQGVGGKTGEMAGRFENFGRAIGSLGSVGGPIAVSTLAIAGVGVAAVAMGYAVVKGAKMATDAIVTLNRTAAETIEKYEELEGTPFGFTDTQIARIDRANDSLDATQYIAERLGVELATNMAPTVESMSVLFVAAGLAASDAFESMTQGVDVLQGALDSVGRLVYTSMIAPFQSVAEHIRDVRSALGMNTDMLDEMIDGWQTWNEVTSEGITQLDSYSGTSLQGYIDQAQQAVRAVTEMTDAQGANTEAVVKAANAVDKLAIAEAALIELRKSAPKQDLDTDKEAVVLAQELAWAKAQEVQGTVEQISAEQTLQNSIGATAQIAQQAAGLMKEGSREAAILGKAAAVTSALANAYAGANAQLAIPGAGPALAAITLALGLANAGAAAAVPLPAFADGGRVPYNAPRAANNGLDERVITARPDEVILTPADYARMRNNGGGQTTVNLQLNNRTLQRVVASTERQTGAISRAAGKPALTQHRDKVTR